MEWFDLNFWRLATFYLLTTWLWFFVGSSGAKKSWLGTPEAEVLSTFAKTALYWPGVLIAYGALSLVVALLRLWALLLHGTDAVFGKRS